MRATDWLQLLLTVLLGAACLLPLTANFPRSQRDRQVLLPAFALLYGLAAVLLACFGLTVLLRGLFSHAGENALQKGREGRRAAGSESARLLSLVVGAVGVHQLAKLRLHRVKLLLVQAHFIQQIVDGLDSQLLGAGQAKPLRIPGTGAGRNKNNRRPFMASGT